MLLNIVTPEKIFFSDQVESTLVPGIDGELGLLPNHAPLVTVLQPGELRYTHNGVEHALAVGEGFVEVTQDHVSILTDIAVTHDEIDEDVEQKAIDRAKKALEDSDHTLEELAAVRASLSKSLAKLDFKRRRR